jgi:hypothetical protein
MALRVARGATKGSSRYRTGDAAKSIWELGEELLAQANAVAGPVDVALEAVKRRPAIKQ